MREYTRESMTQAQKEITTYGYTVLPKLLSETECQELLELVNEHWDERKHKDFKGRPDRELQDRLVYSLQNKDKRFIDILSHPNIEEILKTNLNDPFYKHLPAELPNYILGFYNARSSGPKLDMHTDTFIPAVGPRTWTMQVAFFLEDATKDNGATMLVPGSHISGNWVDRTMDRVEVVEAKAGDVAIWDSRIWHGTTANTSGKSRWVLIGTFTCWWVKQRMDIVRTLPQEIYSQLTEKQKIMLGYCSIPPKGENDRLNFKGGLGDLKANVADYF